MKRIIKFFIIFLVAIGIGFLVHKDPGYILIHYAGWQIETSVWFVVIIILLAYLLIHFLLRIHHHTSTFPGRFTKWQQSSTELQTKTLLHDGMLSLIQGNWKAAENALKKTTKRKSYTALIPLMGCAFAAHMQHLKTRRDLYLKEAILRNPSDQMAIELYQARLQLQDGEWRFALSTLKKWQAIKDSADLTSLLYEAFNQADNWQSMIELIPALKKKNLLTSEVTKQYINALVQLNKPEEAQKAIEAALQEKWDDDLIREYSLLNSNDRAARINFAESLLKEQPHRSQLYLCLGRLTLQEKLLGKAKHYLEQGIKIDATPELYQELAKVYATLGNEQKALEYYNKSTFHQPVFLG